MATYKIILIILGISVVLAYSSILLVTWDTLTYQSYGARWLQILVRLQGIIPLGLASIFLIRTFLWPTITFKYRFEKILFIILFFDLIFFIVGWLHNNNWAYLLGDTLKLAALPVIYFTGLAVYRSGVIGKLFKGVFCLFLAVSLFACLLQFWELVFFNRLIVMSAFEFIFPLTFLLVLPRLTLGKRLSLILLIASVILSLKRGNWIALILIIGSIFLAYGSFKLAGRLVRRICGVCLTILIIASLLAIMTPDISKMILGAITYRWQGALLSKVDSFQTRLGEASAVFEQMKVEASSLDWALGFGNGAEWKMSFYSGQGSVGGIGSRPGLIHHIHIAWAAFLLRNGLVGVFLFGWLCFEFLKLSYAKIRQRIFLAQERVYWITIFVCFIVITVTSLTASAFWGDVNLAVVLVLFGYLLRDQELIEGRGFIKKAFIKAAFVNKTGDHGNSEARQEHLGRQVVLINATSIKMGGGLTYLKNYIKEISKINSPFDFVVLKRVSTLLETQGSPCLKIINVSLSNTWCAKAFFNLFGLRKFLRVYRASLLWQMANFTLPFCPCPQVILLRQAQYFSKIFCREIFPLYPFKRKWAFCWRRWLIIYAVKQANLVIVPSRSLVHDFERQTGLGIEKLVVNCYAPPACDKIPIRSRAPNKRIRLLYLTHYGEHKNLATLLKAVVLLDRMLTVNFEVLISIDLTAKLNQYCVTLRQDRVLAQQLAVKRHVKFIGVLPYEKIGPFYQSADIFVWPTLTESFGHPLVEAMAFGLPIIASDILVNREICVDSALYFEPLNPKDLADKIKLAITDIKLRKKLMEKSQERSKLFSWEDHVKRLLSIFQLLIKY